MMGAGIAARSGIKAKLDIKTIKELSQWLLILN